MDTEQYGAEQAASSLEGSSLPPKKKLRDGYNTRAGDTGERLVLMHSPMGVRVCYSITNSTLELWISPQARKSADYRLRNFSNRDDYTTIFDSIRLPGLCADAYESCEYDPFHSVLHYGDQDLHLLSLADEPGVALWMETGGVVDLKSDKEDGATLRDESSVCVRHPDRGLTFEFAAVAGPGGGTFRHQRALDHGRSIYARVELSPGQPLCVGGELEWERPGESMRRVAARGAAEIVRCNEAVVDREICRGDVLFRDRPAWQRHYDLGRRVLFSAQDYGGAIPAAFRALYYLIWHMDGGVTSVYTAHTGWPEYLRRWAKLEISNPTWTDGPIPGWYYGQLVNGRISKQEEWGTYFCIWSAFSYWVQTGSAEFARGDYLEKILASLRWVEDYTYDPDRGAFGMYYSGEDPLEGTYDWNFDEALGRPMNSRAPSHDGQPIHRSYTFSENVRMYSGYVMLSAMVDGPLASELAERARRLEPFLRACREEDIAGHVQLADGTIAALPAMPRWTPGTLFVPDPTWEPDIIRRSRMFDLEPVRQGEERFVHHVMGNIVAQDPALMGSDRLEEFLEIFLPQCARPGHHLQMAGTVIEDVNCADGSIHDNRPQLFATALIQAAMVGQGLFRLPFGLAVRANECIERIARYEYRGALLEIEFRGEGDVDTVHVGSRVLTRSLQLPDSWLDGPRGITVKMAPREGRPARLVRSQVRLLDVEGGPESVVFRIWACGFNGMCFDERPASCRVLKDGFDVEFELRDAHGWTYLTFDGRGEFDVEIA